jgi:hypothetical protein
MSTVEERLQQIEQTVERLDPRRPRFSADDFRRAMATKVFPVLTPLATDGVLFSVGAETGNAITVAVQFRKGGNRIDILESVVCPWYLATDAAGLTPSAVAPSAGTAAGTDGALIEWTANLSGMMVSEADGDVDVVLTETGAATWYLVISLPNGRIAVSDAITFA